MQLHKGIYVLLFIFTWIFSVSTVALKGEKRPRSRTARVIIAYVPPSHDRLAPASAVSPRTARQPPITPAELGTLLDHPLNSRKFNYSPRTVTGSTLQRVLEQRGGKHVVVNTELRMVVATLPGRLHRKLAALGEAAGIAFIEIDQVMKTMPIGVVDSDDRQVDENERAAKST